MAKHKLKVVRQEIEQWVNDGIVSYPSVIILKCERCDKYLQIERGAMEAMLTDKANHQAWDEDRMKIWRQCEMLYPINRRLL